MWPAISAQRMVPLTAFTERGHMERSHLPLHRQWHGAIGKWYIFIIVLLRFYFRTWYNFRAEEYNDIAFLNTVIEPWSRPLEPPTALQHIWSRGPRGVEAATSAQKV